jgi:hypothetical protein
MDDRDHLYRGCLDLGVRFGTHRRAAGRNFYTGCESDRFELDGKSRDTESRAR